jgi:hypothetical protein
MATIKTIKDAIRICRAAGVTPFIWGHRGLGKSSLVAQLCGYNAWGFLDLRCSQLEASDVRGLPETGVNLGLEGDYRTHYLPPADMPVGDLTQEQITAELAEIVGVSGDSQDEIADKIKDALDKADLDLERRYYNKLQTLQPRFQNGILFIDEVNRAQDDVLQAIFQLVLDRRVGQYVLPPGWCVVAAGNFMEGYQVSGFNDPAFLDRFCHMTLAGGETTLEEWVNWMSDEHGGMAADVIEFASQNVKHLDGDISGELGFTVQPSRRSWESVVKVCEATATGDYSDVAREEVIAGLVGRELGRAFSRYSCPVKPRELLNRGVKAFESKLKTLDRNQMTGLMWGLVSFCKKKIEEDKVAEVCLDFASFMCKHAHDKDVVVAFCRALVSGGNASDHQEKARAAVISNPRLAKMISKFNTRSGAKKKNFIDRLTERPELQSALSRVSWGSTGDESDD